MAVVGITYAQALFQLAVEIDEIKDIYSDFSEIMIFFEEKSLKELLVNPQISTSDKKGMIDSIFSDKINKNLKNFIKILIEKRRIFYVEEIFNDFQKLYNEHFDIEIATITSAFELSADEIERLKMNIEKATGKSIVVNSIVDNSLMAGINVKIGDRMIDASAKRRLDALQLDLMNITLE